MSKIICYTCQKFGHFSKHCLGQRGKFKGRHHVYAVDMDYKPQRKKQKEYDLDKVAKDIRKEYYLISSLSRTITGILDTWLVDSGASRHMTGYQSTLIDLT